jgi:hypothetical protein
MKTGHRKNHGKGFQVPAGPHSFESALKNSPIIEAYPLKCTRTRSVGLLYCHVRKFKNRSFAKKIMQTQFRCDYP